MNVPYIEGDWFAVPLRGGGYAVGLIARLDPKIHSILGYFFGPRRTDIPKISSAHGYTPEDAVLICICGDLGLVQREWSIIGHQQPWNRTVWFGLALERGGTAAPMREGIDQQREARLQDYLGREPLWGAGAVEIRLDTLLPRTDPAVHVEDQHPAETHDTVHAEPSVDHILYYHTQEAAEGVAKHLRQLGYQVQVRTSTDGQWDVIAARAQPLSEDDFDETCDMLEELTASTGGQYDGYERDV